MAGISIIGTAGDDNIVGTPDNDTLIGENGNDFIDGGAGDDSIRGGFNTPGPRGDDTIISGPGNDTIDGDGGNDLIDNSAGGADNLDGDTGNDTFIVSGAEAAVNGGPGNTFTDTVIFSAAAGTTLVIDGRYTSIEQYVFGDTDDLVLVQSGNRDSYTLGGGSDIVRGTAANLNTDVINDFTSSDRILVDGVLTSLFAVVPASGSTPQSLLIDSNGDGVIGAGDLTIGLPNADLTGLRVVAQPALGATEVLFGSGGGSTVDETLTGGPGNDLLAGGDGNETLIGGDGNDTLIGGGGNNVLIGGNGNDVLIGGPGNDLLIGGAGLDTMTGGGGNDTFEGTAGDTNGDSITDFGFGDRIRITGGTNASAVYNAATGQLDINSDGVGGADTFVNVGLNWGNDFLLRFENGTDIIADSRPIPVDDALVIPYETATNIDILGNDLEDFGLTSFTLASLPTHGTLLVNGALASAGSTHGTTGVQLTYVPAADYDGPDAFSYTLTDNSGRGSTTAGVANISVAAPPGVFLEGSNNRKVGDLLVGSEGSDTINGLAGNDTIEGGLRNDLIDGGLGRDVLRGGLGDDTYVGFGKGDVIEDDGGRDTIQVVGKGFKVLPGSIENVIGGGRLTGNGNDNLMVGGGGRDQFIGGDGNDTFVGGAGNDRLYGNGGFDVFRYEGLGDAGRGPKAADQLLDFQSGIDKIDLSAFGGVSRVSFAGGLVSVDGDGNGTIDFDIRVPGFDVNTDVIL